MDSMSGKYVEITLVARKQQLVVRYFKNLCNCLQSHYNGQDLCKRTKGCKWFNWNSKSQCWLKRSHGQKGAPNVRHEEGVSTGPKECPKM